MGSPSFDENAKLQVGLDKAGAVTKFILLASEVCANVGCYFAGLARRYGSGWVFCGLPTTQLHRAVVMFASRLTS